jgi:hypothetical protein
MNTRPATVRGKWLFPDKAMPELIERLSGVTAGI